MTYACAHSSTASIITSHAVDDDNDDNQVTSECSDSTPPPNNSFNDSLHQIRQAVGELEKVNYQLFQLLEAISSPAPSLPHLLHSVNTLQQPKLCPEPQCDCTPQCILLQVLPPAPNPDAIPLQQPAPQIECISCIVPGEFPRVPIPDPTSIPCHLARHPQSTKTTIPNLAKPAVLPPATPMVDVVYDGNTHWPPPQPPMKSAPF